MTDEDGVESIRYEIDFSDKTEREVVAAWINEVLAKNGNTDKWDELYATMIEKITKRYPDAKVVCIQLVENGSYTNNYTNIKLYNKAINAIAEYYGLPVVEQKNVINPQNYHVYMHDNRILHPNANGHRVLFEELVRTLYRDLEDK